jgi:hypothetical protein
LKIENVYVLYPYLSMKYWRYNLDCFYLMSSWLDGYNFGWDSKLLAIDKLQLQIESVPNDKYTVEEGQCQPEVHRYADQILIYRSTMDFWCISARHICYHWLYLRYYGWERCLCPVIRLRVWLYMFEFCLSMRFRNNV